jgi:hypothetical protein
MEYKMGDNLIDVSCAYPKGQGHGSHICVLENMKKIHRKRVNAYFSIKLCTMTDR